MPECAFPLEGKVVGEGMAQSSNFEALFLTV